MARALVKNGTANPNLKSKQEGGPIRRERLKCSLKLETSLKSLDIAKGKDKEVAVTWSF